MDCYIIYYSLFESLPRDPWGFLFFPVFDSQAISTISFLEFLRDSYSYFLESQESTILSNYFMIMKSPGTHPPTFSFP